MTDSTAEDKPEPPPRQIEWLQFDGRSLGPQGEVSVAVSSSFDPYMAETLFVWGYSPLGHNYQRYLTRGGFWADEEAGIQSGDAGFEVPPGFARALQNAFQGELKKAKQEAVDALEAAEAIVETYKKVAALTTTAAESATKRVEQLERETEELRAELEDWREGRVTRG